MGAKFEVNCMDSFLDTTGVWIGTVSYKPGSQPGWFSTLVLWMWAGPLGRFSYGNGGNGGKRQGKRRFCQEDPIFELIDLNNFYSPKQPERIPIGVIVPQLTGRPPGAVFRNNHGPFERHSESWHWVLGRKTAETAETADTPDPAETEGNEGGKRRFCQEDPIFELVDLNNFYSPKKLERIPIGVIVTPFTGKPPGVVLLNIPCVETAVWKVGNVVKSAGFSNKYQFLNLFHKITFTPHRNQTYFQ